MPPVTRESRTLYTVQHHKQERQGHPITDYLEKMGVMFGMHIHMCCAVSLNQPNNYQHINLY